MIYNKKRFPDRQRWEDAKKRTEHMMSLNYEALIVAYPEELEILKKEKPMSYELLIARSKIIKP